MPKEIDGVQPAVDEVYLTTEGEPKLSVLAKLGDGPVTVTSGYGGWEEVRRPGRRALTLWRGREALRMTVPLLLDRFLEGSEGRSVEDECRTLEKMAGLDKGDPEPPLLIVEGILPHDYSRAADNRWVIEKIEWGDAIRRMSNGQRVRQEVVLTLMEHTGDDVLERIKHQVKRPKYRTVRVRPGDTFARIAKRYLGSARLGRKLAQLNGARSPDVRLKRATVKLPTRDELSKWKRGK